MAVCINATLDIEDMQAQVTEMLASSPVEGAEEHAIHDYEGFGGYSISEYEGLEAVRAVAQFIAEYTIFGSALLETPRS